MQAKKDAFYKWLTKMTSSSRFISVFMVIPDVEKFAHSKAVWQGELFDIYDPNVVDLISRAMQKDAFYRLMNRSKMTDINEFLRLFRQYLVECAPKTGALPGVTEDVTTDVENEAGKEDSPVEHSGPAPQAAEIPADVTASADESDSVSASGDVNTQISEQETDATTAEVEPLSRFKEWLQQGYFEEIQINSIIQTLHDLDHFALRNGLIVRSFFEIEDYPDLRTVWDAVRTIPLFVQFDKSSFKRYSREMRRYLVYRKALQRKNKTKGTAQPAEGQEATTSSTVSQGTIPHTGISGSEGNSTVMEELASGDVAQDAVQDENTAVSPVATTEVQTSDSSSEEAPSLQDSAPIKRIDIIESFRIWLNSKGYNNAAIAKIVHALIDADSFLRKTEILKESIFSIAELADLSTLLDYSEKQLKFIAHDKAKNKACSNALELFLEFRSSSSGHDMFIPSPSNLAQDPAGHAATADAPVETDNGTESGDVGSAASIAGVIEVDEPESAAVPQQVEAQKDVETLTGKTESDTHIEEPANNSVLEEDYQAATENAEDMIIDFSSDLRYSFIRPVSAEYFGEEILESSWRKLYVKICRHLYEDYPHVFRRLAEQSDAGEKDRIVYGSASAWRLLAPAEVAENIFVECHQSASDIFKCIKKLLDHCNVDYKNLVIRYVGVAAKNSIGNAETAEPVFQNDDTILPADAVDPILLYLSENHLEYIDLRPQNGYLWIIGGMEIAEVMRKLTEHGVSVNFKFSGSTATGGRDAWWTSDSADRFEKREKNALPEQPEEQIGLQTAHSPTETSVLDESASESQNDTTASEQSKQNPSNADSSSTSEGTREEIIDRFKEWLRSQKFYENQCDDICKTIIQLDDFILAQGLLHKSILTTTDYADLRMIWSAVCDMPHFQAFDKDNHKRFTRVMKWFLKFRKASEDKKKTAETAIVSEPQKQEPSAPENNAASPEMPDRRQAFRDWLVRMDIPAGSINTYIACLDHIGLYLRDHEIEERDIYTIDDVERLKRLRSVLMRSDDYTKVNPGRTISLDIYAFSKYITFREMKPAKSGDTADKTVNTPANKAEPVSSSPISDSAQKTKTAMDAAQESAIAAASEKEKETLRRFESILRECFITGFYPGKDIDYRRFRQIYTVRYGESPRQSDIEIMHIMLRVGEQRFSRIFAKKKIPTAPNGVDRPAEPPRGQERVSPTQERVAPVQRRVEFDKEKIIAVLYSRFKNGMKFDSIDLENFTTAYEELHGEPANLTDDELKFAIGVCGVKYQGKVFPADAIIDPATAEKIFAYIDRCFAEGKKTIYYKAIMTDMSDDLAYCFNLRDADMLRAFLEYKAPVGKFFCYRDYLSKERGAVADPKTEVDEYMRSAGKPVSYDEIYAALSHIPKEKIRQILSAESEYITNANNERFHICTFDVTEDEIKAVCDFLDASIAENGFCHWNQAAEHISANLPGVAEKNPYLTPIGLRNAFSFRLGSKYHFGNAIISQKGKALNMAELFQLFAKNHPTFTLDELSEFANELDTRIYFESVSAYAVRISKDMFVSRDLIRFDAAEIDFAISNCFSGDYIPITEIESFLLFPSVGYEWNMFLLESYLLFYSKKYTLINTVRSKSSVAGVIAPKHGKYQTFNDICADFLAKSDCGLTKDEALEFLVRRGLLSRARFSDIQQVLEKAQRIRGGKE